MNKLINSVRLQSLAIFFIPLLIYGNTLLNNYALDDSIVITENEFVQQGIKGIPEILGTDSFTGFFKRQKKLVEGGRYRPLSLVTFAIEHQFAGNNPFISHLINALLYSLLCLILYKLLIEIQEWLGQRNHPMQVAFFSTLLFIVHPIHTEVVANIKGRDELMALLFGLLSLYCYLKYLKKVTVISIIFCGIYFILGMLSKEDAVVIPVIVLIVALVRVLFPSGDESKNHLKYFTGLIPMFIAGIIYWVIRDHAIGTFNAAPSAELMNNPFLHATSGQKYATILYTLLLYIKLLFVPYPLTYDYYPYHIALQQWSNGWPILSLIIYSGLLVALVMLLRRNRFLFFCLLFYLVPLLLVSNLFINIGTFMNERFVFFSSVGFCTGIVYLIVGLKEKSFENITLKKWPGIMAILVFLIFSGMTVARNTDWKDNYTLFLHDVKISANSAKGNCTAGGALLEKAQDEKNEILKKQLLSRSIAHLQKSVSIYPGYVDALVLLGNAYYEDKNFDPAVKCYLKVLSDASGYVLARKNLKKILRACPDARLRLIGYKQLLKTSPADFDVNYQLGITYGKMLNNLDSAVFFLKRAEKIQPDNKDLIRDLGVALAMSGKYAASLPYFQRTCELNPDDPSNLINLGMTYRNLGNTVKAKECFARAEMLKKKKK